MGTSHELLSLKVRFCFFSFFILFFSFFSFSFFLSRSRGRLEKMDSRLIVLVLLYPVAMVSADPPAICSTAPEAEMPPCCKEYNRKVAAGPDGQITWMPPVCDGDGSYSPGLHPWYSQDGKITYICRDRSGEEYTGTLNGKKAEWGDEGLNCDRRLAELVERVMRQRESQRI